MEQLVVWRPALLERDEMAEAEVPVVMTEAEDGEIEMQELDELTVELDELTEELEEIELSEEQQAWVCSVLELQQVS